MRRQPAQKILGILALTGFVFVALFWWTGMHEGKDHTCISATIQGVACPDAASTDAVVFHANTVRSLIAGTLQPGNLLPLLLLLVVLSLATLFSPEGGGLHRTDAREQSRQDISVRRERHRWLSLLEHSPAAT